MFFLTAIGLPRGALGGCNRVSSEESLGELLSRDGPQLAERMPTLSWLPPWKTQGNISCLRKALGGYSYGQNLLTCAFKFF